MSDSTLAPDLLARAIQAAKTAVSVSVGDCRVGVTASGRIYLIRARKDQQDRGLLPGGKPSEMPEWLVHPDGTAYELLPIQQKLAADGKL